MRKVFAFVLLLFMVLAVSCVSTTGNGESLSTEYNGPFDLDATLAKLGTVDKICYYVGETGQTKPYIRALTSGISLVSAAAQFSSFNQDVLEAGSSGPGPQNPYFTQGYKAYDLDYENSNLIFAELDIFLDDETGELAGVEVRKITNPEALDSRNYAEVYAMYPKFLAMDHYDSNTGKYIDIKASDGSIYYCEYNGILDLGATLADFGTVEKLCIFTGGTGQTKPYVWTDGSGVSLVSAAAQFSSFNQDLIEAKSTEKMPQYTYFTHGYKAYDLDYENSNLIFAELNLFFDDETGELSSVQIRKITNPEELSSGKYASTYKMAPSIMKENHYDSETGKYVDIKASDGSIYYCEYEGQYDLDATLARLGTIDKLCYYTGKTGQIKPYIRTNKPGEAWVSVAAQFSSFKQDLLEANSTGTFDGHTYFTNGYKAYDLDYENSNLFFAELAIFLDDNGEMKGVQVRKITNPEALASGDYAITYFMKPSFVVNEE